MTLRVTYASAVDFVTDYLESLSIGGMFVPDVMTVDLLREVEVDIVLPGSPTLRVRAKPVFVLDEHAAQLSGRHPGTCMEITGKPPGFDESLRKHFVKLGKRREVAIMIGDVPGARRFGEAGFKLVPLESLEALTSTLADALIQVIAIVVPPGMAEAYQTVARAGGKFVAVHGVGRATEIDDVIAKVDRLFGTGATGRISREAILTF